jgi:hypothetical protein
MPGADMAGRRDRPDLPDEPAPPHDASRPAAGERPDRPTRTDQADLTRLQDHLDELPHGHPSSPYHQDGTRRPPTINLRDLELPLDNDPEPDSPHETPESLDSADSTRGNTLQDAMPALQASWESHLERWPAKNQHSTDQWTDEPGAWHSDSGQYLNAEKNSLAERSLDRVSKIEPEVTRAMKAIESTVQGARLVGLEHCLKGQDRLKEKVAHESDQKPDRSVHEIVDRIPDKIRYTCQFSEDQYTEGYWNFSSQLEEQGNDLLLSRNSWNDLEYKGVNTRWLTPEGHTFEIQFHTPDSFEAKQLTHEAYERLRSGDPLSAERPALEDFQCLVTSKIQIPKDVTSIPDYRREGY